MNYLVVVGSPRRKGNTSSLAIEFKRQVEELGHSCDLLYLSNMNYKGCVHCNYCVDNIDKGCILKDDITETLNNMDNYHCVIIASPLYFFYFTAQTKAFLDRLYSVDKQDLILGAIITSGSEFFDGGSDLAIETLRRSCNYCGMEWVGAVQKTTSDKILEVTSVDKLNIEKLVVSTEQVSDNTDSIFISN